jgi:hypothetical protein
MAQDQTQTEELNDETKLNRYQGEEKTVGVEQALQKLSKD